MELLTKSQTLQRKEEIIEEIKKGKIFIYPTDTVYGLGCNALLPDSIKKLRTIKNRDARPFSIIAPNKDWIIKNCEIDEFAKKWLNRIPGKYTLIMKLKNKECISSETNNYMDSIGVRIPDNWFSKILAETDIPFITTSVNLQGDSPMTSLGDVNEKIKESVDYLIYQGEKKGKPSAIINTITQEIMRR